MTHKPELIVTLSLLQAVHVELFEHVTQPSIRLEQGVHLDEFIAEELSMQEEQTVELEQVRHPGIIDEQTSHLPEEFTA